ncbi:MAG: hypothetical protein ACK4GT_04190 [Pararhodobacter sp.]
MAYDPNSPRNTTNTTTNTTRPAGTPPVGASPRSGNNMPFIIGGLVVLVAIIAYFVFARPATNNPAVTSTAPAAVTGTEPAGVDRAPLGTTAPTAVGPDTGAPVPGTDATGTPAPGTAAPAGN